MLNSQSKKFFNKKHTVNREKSRKMIEVTLRYKGITLAMIMGTGLGPDLPSGRLS